MAKNKKRQDGRPTACVLLSNATPESKTARALLKEADVPFSEITTDTPGYENHKAPMLYTADGILPHLDGIRTWVRMYRDGKTLIQRRDARAAADPKAAEI